MFIVLLKFSKNKEKAGALMAEHKRWLQRGFEEGTFLLAGGIQPSAGGAVLATAHDMDEMKSLVAQDPFVAEQVVTAEIIEVTPHQAEERLAFLINNKE